MLKDFHDLIITKENTIMMDLNIFRRGYLVGKTSEARYYAGEPDDQRLKKDDMELLKLIANNARMSIVEMAKLLKFH